eukprot:TRINITY_DN240_c0_g1_i1.p1 TRINITY_DN240_c0_g1~~TRINITY_DN240_c0_g1_i1.p1  ORF type:complete len:112 (+),score=15.80 TRINITY_DN240_c0_g1_i1:127-462(+)
MASITMAASFLGGVTVSEKPSITRRRVVMAKAMKPEGDQIEKLNSNNYNDKRNGSNRRDVMFAAAAAAICSIAAGQGGAIAAGEPKRGTPEAKKIYAPVCVTMPTARICHK